MDKKTKLIHQPKSKIKANNQPVVSPIYHSVKYVFDSYADFEANSGRGDFHHYSRVSNPTREQLEIVLADLQGCEEALAAASGISAISACLFGLLKKDDHVIMFIESYKPSRFLVLELLSKFGVSSSLISIHDHKKIISAIQPGKTKLILFESPTNPMLQIADIEFITNLAKKNNIITVLDNTFAGLHQHQKYNIDIYLHSLTKYAAGHSDVLGGAIIGSKALLAKIKPVFYEFGVALDPHACSLISRSLKTYFLRYQAACASALKISEFPQSHSKVKHVVYPGLASHPQQALAKKQLEDFTPMLVFEPALNPVQLGSFLDNLKLFHVTWGLGTVESTIVPVKFYCTDLNQEQKLISGTNDCALRVSVGIETTSDLIADLEQALSKIK